MRPLITCLLVSGLLLVPLAPLQVLAVESGGVGVMGPETRSNWDPNLRSNMSRLEQEPAEKPIEMAKAPPSQGFPLPDRQWVPGGMSQVKTPEGEAMVASPPSSQINRPDLVIRGKVEGNDIHLAFPQTTLPYTVSFKAPGIYKTQVGLNKDPSIRWISPTELVISKEGLARSAGAQQEFWCWGQLESGDALLQRVHFD